MSVKVAKVEIKIHFFLYILNFSLYKTNRFHVAVRLFSNWTRRTSKCGKNIIDTLGWASCGTFLFLPHLNIICDLLLNRCTTNYLLNIHNDSGGLHLKHFCDVTESPCQIIIIVTCQGLLYVQHKIIQRDKRKPAFSLGLCWQHHFFASDMQQFYQESTYMYPPFISQALPTSYHDSKNIIRQK